MCSYTARKQHNRKFLNAKATIALGLLPLQLKPICLYYDGYLNYYTVCICLSIYLVVFMPASVRSCDV